MNGIANFICNNILYILAVVVIAYLIGSISPSIIITKITTKNEDIRNMGSGSAGFTNVLRSVGKTQAILTILLDFAKGSIAVLVGAFIFSKIPLAETHHIIINYGKYLAGLFVILGHIFPAFFGFRGGKGVVTFAAMIALVDWRVFLILLVIAMIILFVKKIVSLASIIGAALYPVVPFCITYFIDYLPHKGTSGAVSMSYIISATLISLVIGLIVIIKHKENIKRLLKGEEKKISAKNK
ncbi:MAG: glycerol-3-phosphate 1-O-acyltransferase PlsY [Bacillota bacterium]|nr:glycerol-3-phosphate 1-O-acyltransferase PlsY [Bacillota bacterium]